MAKTSHNLTFERYLWFIERARRNGFPNPAKLADKFEKSLIQARRDIAFMRDRLGAPLEYERERNGYVLTDTAYQLPYVWIEPSELLMLAISGKVVHAREAQKKLQDLFAKIALCEPAEAERMTQCVSWKGMGFYRENAPVFTRVVESLIKQKQIDFLHHRVFSPAEADGRVTISPLHLICYRNDWYLLAHNQDGLRTYSLHRMEDVKLLDAKALSPITVGEVATMIRQNFGIFITGTAISEEIKLRFDATLRRYIKAVVFHPDQTMVENPDGTVTITFRSQINRELIGEILRLSDSVDILAPASLRAQVAEIVCKAYNRHCGK